MKSVEDSKEKERKRNEEEEWVMVDWTETAEVMEVIEVDKFILVVDVGDCEKRKVVKRMYIVGERQKTGLK